MSSPIETAVESTDGRPAPRWRVDAVAAVLAVAGGGLLAVAPSTAVSVASVGVLVAAFALEPAFSLPLLAVALPFYLLPRGFGSLAFSMPELVLISALAGAALRALWLRRGVRGGLERLATPFDAPIALFLAAALLSLLASEVMRVSLRELRTLILEPVAAFYLAVWLLRRRAVLPWLLGALLFGGAAAAGLGLYQYFLTDHVVAVEGARRVLGPYLSPNQLGLYLGRCIPLALAIVLFGHGYRWVAGVALAALVAVQLLTFSVGAWLATLLAIACVLLLWRPRALAVMAAAATALAVASVPVLASERVSSHLSLTRGTSFIRVQLWESSLRMIQDHPILGVGMDNFLYQYRSGYLLPDAVAEPNLSHPHNLVLNFWLQLGALGLAAFLWLAVALVRRWRRLWRARPDGWERVWLAGMAGAGVDMVAHGLVDNSYFLVDMAFFFWLCAAVLAAMRTASRGERDALPGLE